MEREVLAQRLLSLAKNIVADAPAEDMRQRKAYDPDAELEARMKELGALADEFKDKHAGLIAAVAAAEKAKKAAEDVLKQTYAGWKKDSGYEKMRREVLKQAEQCMDIGDKLEDFGDDIISQLAIVQRQSGQVAYKEFLNVLVTTLNDAEMKKFVGLLDQYFRKVTTQLKTGIKVLDGQVQDFQQEAHDLAAERGITLKASTRSREAGLKDIWVVVQDLVPKLTKKVTSIMTALYNRVFKAGRVLEGMDGAVDKMIARTSRVL